MLKCTARSDGFDLTELLSRGNGDHVDGRRRVLVDDHQAHALHARQRHCLRSAVSHGVCANGFSHQSESLVEAKNPALVSLLKQLSNNAIELP